TKLLQLIELGFKKADNQNNCRPMASGVDLLSWPPRSAIAHVWGRMDRRLTNLRNPPEILEALQHAVQVAWDKKPQADDDHLIRFMLRPLDESINKRGDQTHY
ncbi:hypothetical protein BDFB_014509, partial [Asbolus verrucosus]